MTHVKNSSVARDTDDTTIIDGEKRQLIAALTPEGVVIRPKGLSKSRSLTFTYAEIFEASAAPKVAEDSLDEDKDAWDRGYTQGQADLKDYVKRRLKK